MKQRHGGRRLGCMVMGVAAGLTASVTAAPEVDQSYATTCDSLVPLQCVYMNPVDFDWQQEIVAGVDGTLAGIDLWFYVSNSFPPGPVSVSLHRGAPPKLDVPLYTKQIEVTLDKMYHIDLTAAGLDLVAGESFTLHIGPSTGPYVDATLFAVPGDGYAGELWVRNGDGSWGLFEPDLDWDLAFVTYMEADAGGDGEVEPTPCPSDCGNNDGVVDVADFLALLGEWGTAGGACDEGGDGVGITELLALLASWGPCP